jgi:DNA-binding GntR family transcriptional regulator
MSRVSGLAELVRLMVLRGEVPAGGRLVELHLAEKLRTGRSTIREALRRLEGDGLLVANDSGGMRVVRLDREELAATLQVRSALEALSAGLAARRVRDGELAPATVEELAALADVADAAARGGTRDQAVVADRAFHRAVDALAENRPCHAALNRLWDQIVVACRQAMAVPPRAQLADREHRELLIAISTGDEDEAAETARRHVLAALA